MKFWKNILTAVAGDNAGRRSGWYLPLSGGTEAKGDAFHNRVAAQESLRLSYYMR